MSPVFHHHFIDMKNLPLIHSYDSIESLTKSAKKSDREHDLVIAVSYTSAKVQASVAHFSLLSLIFLFLLLKSYVLGEIPSLKDRISIVRQLWGLTTDVLVPFTLRNDFHFLFNCSET